ncbi:MAG TPA: hypothetical protein VFQ14_03465 [Thermoleophilaceae bacterium]|nr:hypothetical protein [Thermoleophilaceae bacterium]
MLAVIFAVPEFAYSLLADLGAPKGRIETFTEIQLRDADGKRCIPDGAVVVTRGSKEWKCLVEVKTGTAHLQPEQVVRYLDWARDNGFDAVLTISNEITASASDIPITVDKRKLKRVSLFHLSWWRILTEAIVQHRHRGLSDPDQAWLLGQLIAYLDHHKSGASGFQGMGESWVTVRTAAANETLRSRDAGALEVAERWEQFVDYVALGLGQDLGRDVVPVRSKRVSSEARIDETVRRLVETGELEAALKVPDAVGNLQLEANLRTRKVTTSVEIAAPRDGRPKTRINWLLRQLRHAPPDLRIDVSFVNARETSSLLLSEANETPARLLSGTDPKRPPRTFRVALTRKMGAKRGKDAGSFVRETRTQAIDFYRDLVQDLRKWQAPVQRRELPSAGRRDRLGEAEEEVWVVGLLDLVQAGEVGGVVGALPVG